MLRLLASATAFALLSTAAAYAADLPLPDEPMPEAVVTSAFNWTGFYVGINGGWGANDTDVNYDFTPAPPGGFFTCNTTPSGGGVVCPDDFNYDTEGFLVGGHAGAWWQNGWVVFGVEGDIDWSDMNGGATVAQTNAGTGFVPFAADIDSDYSWFGTARGQLGAAFGRVMVYGTGGAAFAQIDDSVNSWGFPTLGQTYSGSQDDTFFGWTAGGGVNVAVTNHIVIGAHALYFDLGDQSFDLTPGFAAPAGTNVEANFEHTGWLARGQVSWKFP